MQEALARTLEQRSAELVMNARNRSVDGAVPDEASASRAARGLAIDDFVRYMVQEQTREAILKEFIDVVRPLLEAGRTLHIVAHSWGSVVAYEGLRRLDDIQGGGIVDTLFTVGAAISMAPVQANLFDRTQDGRLPDRVSRIINLDARGDIVGGRVADQFEGARDFVRLSPTGCRTIPFTGTTLNFACAHSSYFEPANKAVNRDLFARFINGS
jgi:pimeloyl-ACP methyl ester carboxylesterase